MFVAVEKASGEEIVILHTRWQDQMDLLRERCRLDILACPVCRQPVWAKAGHGLVRRHFAHKHLASCPSTHESPELIQARAVLYDWLCGKFGTERVAIEKRFENLEPPLPRHIDCWVLTEAGTNLAYWISDKQMKPDDRLQLPTAISSVGGSLVMIFLVQTMQRNHTPNGILNLNTTEREFISLSEHDEIYPAAGDNVLGSLHYLNAEKETLTTFRAMCRTEHPQQHTGMEITSSLASLELSPHTGNFVHPGEHESLILFRRKAEKQRLLDEDKRRRDAERQHLINEREARQHAERQKLWDMIGIRRDGDATASFSFIRQSIKPVTPPISMPPPNSVYDDAEGTCEFCGQQTRDWIVYDGKTKSCQCRTCIDQNPKKKR